MKVLEAGAALAAAAFLLAACGTPRGPQVAAATTDARSSKVEFRITGRIAGVSDGDTLAISGPSRSTTIRMSDMDTPEVSHGSSQPGQRFGRAAEASLKSLAPIGAQARADCYERDTYDRSVCTVFVGSTNLNLEQIRRGWGMLPDNPTWIRDPQSAPAQASARQKRVGVWQVSDPQSPASWRDQCWQQGQCPNAEP